MRTCFSQRESAGESVGVGTHCWTRRFVGLWRRSVKTWSRPLLLDEPEGESRTTQNRDGHGEHRNDARAVKPCAEPQSHKGDNEDEDTDTNGPLPLTDEKGAVS